jgi:hypothetical protein
MNITALLSELNYRLRLARTQQRWDDAASLLSEIKNVETTREILRRIKAENAAITRKVPS